MLPPLPALPLTWRSDLAKIITLALLARLLVIALWIARGHEFPFIDAHGYLSQARHLLEHGDLAIPEPHGARFFHGVPLLLAGLARLTGQLASLALPLNYLLAAAACALFYLHFPRLDWSAWHALLLPAWLSMTSTLHGEAALWTFSLLGLAALRLPAAHRLRAPLLLLAGYAMVCRPTAFLILLPAFLLSHFPPAPRAWTRLLAEAALLGAFPLLMAAWSLAETGHLFIQSRWQADEFAWWARHWGGGFPETVFTWPGHSLLATFASEQIRLPVKLLNLAHLLFFLAALALAARAWLRDRTDTLAAWFLLSLALNGAFLLTLGGPFGGTIFYRFLATQANVFVLVAWFRYASLPPVLWWTASAASIALASLIARSA